MRVRHLGGTNWRSDRNAEKYKKIEKVMSAYQRPHDTPNPDTPLIWFDQRGIKIRKTKLLSRFGYGRSQVIADDEEEDVEKFHTREMKTKKFKNWREERAALAEKRAEAAGEE